MWVEKYGEEEANKRLNQLKAKHSKNNSGKNNPMYGKPSPQGSGNGWKGWYKGFFFRSLRELCYMIHLEESNMNWISGESTSIRYTFNNKERTYRPDFIVGKRIIEIKPIKLHNTPNILAKAEAAKEYCKQSGYEYQIIDWEIDYEKILDHESCIKFMEKYQEKFDEYKKTKSTT